jgi:single-strand DNA-binding protein
MNKVMFCGNIGKIEIKNTASGMSICNFSVALNERVKKGDSYENETTWVNCIAFGKTGEHINTYLAKGSKILITDAKFRLEQWEKDGQKHSKPTFIVNTWEFVESKKDNAGAGNSNQYQAPSPQQDAPTFSSSLPPLDEGDLPF